MSDEKPTVRQRMEALGWHLCACEDTCAAQWVKVASDGRGCHYEGDGEWRRDLDRCQEEYGYNAGESAYL